jgi:hypothetical protein
MTPSDGYEISSALAIVELAAAAAATISILLMVDFITKYPFVFSATIIYFSCEQGIPRTGKSQLPPQGGSARLFCNEVYDRAARAADDDKCASAIKRVRVGIAEALVAPRVAVADGDDAPGKRRGE